MESNQKENIQILLNEESVKRSMILKAVIAQMRIPMKTLMKEWGLSRPTLDKYLNDILILGYYDLVFLSVKLQVSITAMHDLVQGKYESPEAFITQNNIKIY
jgi:hypothetical protein